MPPKKKGIAPPQGYGGNIMNYFNGSQATQRRPTGTGLAGGHSLTRPATQNAKGPTESTAPSTAIEKDITPSAVSTMHSTNEASASAAPTQNIPDSAAAAPSLPSPTNPLFSSEVQRILAENASRASKKVEAEALLQQQLAVARREEAERTANGCPLHPNMNPEQREAAMAPIDRPLMIVAGAGTGKTTTILQRVRYLVLHRDVHPSKIVLITFTVKSAKEAQERLQKLGLPGADLTWVGTFHSLCFSILRRHWRSAGFARLPTVISEDADLRKIVSMAMIRDQVERLKDEICGWLQLPMLETRWPGVVAEVMEQHPQLYTKAAEEAAKWFIEKGVTAKKKKAKAAAGGKGGAGRKRKVPDDRGPVAAAVAAGGGSGSGSAVVSPKKQSKLTDGRRRAAPRSVVSGAAGAVAAAVEGSQHQRAEAPVEDFDFDFSVEDPVLLAAAGNLDDMPRELQTALCAHLYAALWHKFDLQGFKLRQELCNNQRKKEKDTVAGSFLAKFPAKDVKKAQEQIENVKRRGMAVDQIEAPSMQRLYGLYQEELMAQNAVDFNDLLLHVRTMFQEHPQIALRLQERYPHIIVDEFQDTNAVQMDILGAIAPPRDSPSLTVVGDGDQSIYRFRGADPHILHAFMTCYEHPDLRKRLELNYRCTSNVLDVAAATLVGNEHSRDPEERLRATKDGPAEKVTVVGLGNEAGEARWIAGQIAERIAGGTRPEDMAVLFRNFKTKFGRTYTQLTDVLESKGIPYRVVREMSLLQRADVKNILAYIDLLLNPDNDPAFLRVYNIPGRKLGKVFEQRLLLAQEESLAAGSRLSLMACSRNLIKNGGLGPQQAKNLRDFVTSIDELRANLVVLRPPEVIDRIVQRTGYLEYLKAQREKKMKKKEAAGEDTNDVEDDEALEEEEDEDEDGGSDGEEEEEAGQETAVETAAGVAAADPASLASNGNLEAASVHWPYAFNCKLTGPLRRLQGEAIKWVKEAAPRLGLAGDSAYDSTSEDDSLGPPRLESLCYQALSTPEGMVQLLEVLQNGTQGAWNATALEVVTAASACGPGPLADFQSYLRLGQTDITASSLSSAEVGVSISTIHAAKGLEWPVVFVPRLNEGFLPAIKEIAASDDEDGGEDAAGALIAHNRLAVMGQEGERIQISETEEEIAEERRLAHVATTRAKDKLYLTYIRRSLKFDMELEISRILINVMQRCGHVVEVLETGE